MNQSHPSRLRLAEAEKSKVKSQNQSSKIHEELEAEFANFKKLALENMAKDKFSTVLTDLHEFLWHRLADYYIEQLKEELINGNIKTLETLKRIFLESIVLLHTFMPFITHELYQVFEGEEASILDYKL